MKKVGIITKYYNSANYGGLLQAFALAEYLNSCGYNAFQICFDEKLEKRKYRLTTAERFREASLNEKIGRINKKISAGIEKKLTRLIVEKKIEEKKKAVTDFRDAIPHSDKVYSVSALKELDDAVDCFITGSDRVWSEKSIGDPYYLSFAEKGKKISYAASLRTNVLNETQRSALFESLRSFDAVSVREKETVGILQSVGIKNAEWVLDPTFLLPVSKWQTIAESEKPGIEEKYIFCYFLGDDVANRKLARKFARAKDLKIVTLPYANDKFCFADLCFADFRDNKVSPPRFLSLIQNAQYVLTDSFHASVFSLIFHKQFFVFPRRKLEGSGTRIESLVSSLEIEDRFCTAKERRNSVYLCSAQDMDYSVIEEKLLNYRNQSKMFLQEAVEK
ncbi:MAG: polysaccharide pyruvyl transferase family protein [Lachnospiraceae bacterium]|nr:polysaccharide pyruvyl transferase family protein [Lachnospiraceae bacterium]